MSQQDQSDLSLLDHFVPHTARQHDDMAGNSGQSPLQSIGPSRKRAPLASVACQSCRKRKTKCDNKKPVCSKCAKRGITNCTYDLEPNQSRVAAYKQKIEHQVSTIKALEDEIRRLKQSSSRSDGRAVSELGQSFPGPSGRLPMRYLLNPAPEPYRPFQTLDGQGLPAPEPAVSSTSQSNTREVELLSHQRDLEIENRTLKELLILLNSAEDRKFAQQMAEEICAHGVSDSLLARAQHLFALQVRSAPLSKS